LELESTARWALAAMAERVATPERQAMAVTVVPETLGRQTAAMAAMAETPDRREVVVPED
jgi:hypothetical protein